MSTDMSFLKTSLEKAEAAYEDDDVNLAIKLYSEIYEQYSSAQACQNLGFIYKTGGPGVPVDEFKSGLWYRRYIGLLENRVSKGEAEAALELGKLFEYGDNVSVDYERAFSLIKWAAEEGSTEAQFHLAMLYYHGRSGVHQSKDLFEYWLDAACTNEHLEALYTKGMYLNDFSLIEKAANGGFWPAEEYIKNRNFRNS